LSGAYLPPDHVDTGPIPAITDDMTADDVARLAASSASSSGEDNEPDGGGETALHAISVHAIVKQGADAGTPVPVRPSSNGTPAVTEARSGGPGQGKNADGDPVAVTTVFAPAVGAEAAGSAEPIETDAGTDVAAATEVVSHDAMDVDSGIDPAAVTAVFASPVLPPAKSGEPVGTDADADDEVSAPDDADAGDVAAEIRDGGTDTGIPAESGGADDSGADDSGDDDSGDDGVVADVVQDAGGAVPEGVPAEEVGAENAAADPGLDAEGDADVVADTSVDGVADDDAGAVTTMFTVVTEETREDADTTSFAVVSLDAAGDPEGIAAGGGAGARTPPARRQRSRAVLLATAGAVAVVVVGVAAAAAFGGQGNGGPASAPVPSVPAVPSAGPTPLAKPFPRYPGTKSLVIGRIIDRKAHLSYSRLGGKWSLGQDPRKLATALGVSRKGPQLRGVMEAGRAEYLSAPLPATLGTSATPEAAQAVARKVIGTGQAKPPTLRTYAAERLTGGLQGWWVGVQALTGSTDGEIVAVAVVDTGAARPGVFYVAVPKGDKAVRTDIRALVKSLRVVR
jgi:hypothetical protein